MRRSAAFFGAIRWQAWVAVAGVVTVGGFLLAAPRPGGSSAPDIAPVVDAAPTTSTTSVASSSTVAPAVASTTSLAATTSTSSTSTSTSTSTTSTSTTSTTVAPTTTAAPSTTPPTGLLLLDVLAFATITNEHRGGYDRDLFDHWISQGGGCTTRDVVLGRDSSTPVQRDLFGCDVVAGDWFSVYDGAELTDPSDVDIDHVVALKEAWDSGAWAWGYEQRRAFANDLSDARTLRAVHDSANQDKGDRDPSNWLPPRQQHWCTYLGDWVAIKVRWGLSMDQSEYGRIRNVVRERCPTWRIEPVDPLPAFPPPAPAVSIQPIAPLPVAPPTGSGGGAPVYFENCDAARAAGAAPVRRGDPGYRKGLDRDGDGVGCE